MPAQAKTYLVTAEHAVPKYACKDLRVQVYEYGDGSDLWYAIAPGYGCGRNYATPKDAIVGLLRAAACTNIQVKEI